MAHICSIHEGMQGHEVWRPLPHTLSAPLVLMRLFPAFLVHLLGTIARLSETLQPGPSFLALPAGCMYADPP